MVDEFKFVVVLRRNKFTSVRVIVKLLICMEIILYYDKIKNSKGELNKIH
jgi:hypothetical protein